MHNNNTMTLAIAIYAAVIVLIFHTLPVNAQGNAIASNDKKVVAKVASEEVVDFLVKSADARMMEAQGGLLASERGSSQPIRKYGQQMMKDQSMLLKEIKKLARARNVSLRREMSNKKVADHWNLREARGDEFDKKFVEIMTEELERDIKLFGKAVLSGDEEIRKFAEHYLPLIQSHVNTINEIKGQQKE